jgi:hypothetical protein
VDGARYQDNGPLTNAALWLDFSQADTGFSTTVPFSQITLPYSSTTQLSGDLQHRDPGRQRLCARQRDHAGGHDDHHRRPAPRPTRSS